MEERARELLAAEYERAGFAGLAKLAREVRGAVPSAVDPALRAIEKALALSPTPSREGVEEAAKAVHRGRFWPGQEPSPWEDEDARGQEYCRRIAREVLALTSSPPPVGGEI